MWFSGVFCLALFAVVSAATLEETPVEVNPVQETQVAPVENADSTQEQKRDKRFLLKKKLLAVLAAGYIYGRYGHAHPPAHEPAQYVHGEYGYEGYHGHEYEHHEHEYEHHGHEYEDHGDEDEHHVHKYEHHGDEDEHHVHKYEHYGDEDEYHVHEGYGEKAGFVGIGIGADIGVGGGVVGYGQGGWW